MGALSVEAVRDEVALALGVAPADLGAHDDLIAAGLDSIRTMKLAGRWRKRGHAVNFAELAARPTIAAWQELLGGDSDEAKAEAAPVDVEETAAHDPFPLGSMQHAYWIGRLDGQQLGGVAAHLYVEFDGGDVDPARLRTAVDAVVARHPMLRTRILPDGTQQIQPVPGRPVFAVADLRELSDEQVADTLARSRTDKTHQRLALDDAQVLDVTLSLLPGGRTRLHLDVDMIAGDAQSYRVLVSDLAEYYHGATLPGIGYSYRRYRMERPELAGRAAARDWWQRRLADLPGPPELPTVPESGQGGPNRTVRHDFWLDAQAKERLTAGARARGITPAAALASVFAETIGGWSATDRFLLNVPLFHRDAAHPDIDRVVGDFTSSVMVAVDVSAPVTVAERARELQRVLHESIAHADYSGLEVLRDLGRLRGESVLAPVVYTSALNLGELFADTVTRTFGEPAWIISQGPQVLLDAQVTEVRGGLLLNWDVRASAFPPGVVAAMFARYTDAVRRLAEGDAGWAAEAPVRLPVAQATVRASVNATETPFSGRCLHDGFFARAATAPEADAVRWGVAGADGSWSYAELARRALAVAGALAEAGVEVGDAVAVQLPKGRDQVAAVLGVLAAGAAYVPIGFDQPVARRAEILRTSQAVAMVAVLDSSVAACELTCPMVDITAAQRHQTPLPAPLPVEPTAVAYVLFTSGSTGVPKGVEVQHQAAVNTLDAVNDWFDVGARDRVLGLAALEFDASVYDIFGLLAVGGTYVALDAAQRAEATTWVELLRHHRVSILNCVPSMLDMVLNLGGDQLGDSLRAVTLGGDWVGADLVDRLARQVPGCRFSGLGGATETAIHHSICEVTEPQPDWQTVPFGVPLRNVRCRIVGPSGRDCPDWVGGELWVGGNVAAGYRGDPGKTAERFVTHEGVRWYRTGDMARYWPDGTVEFLGRTDHQVQIRGYRVELGEVENALRAASGVRHAVAAVVGDAAPRLVAVVAGDVRAQDVVDMAATLVPDYMVPSRIEVVDEIPLTANGKLDRRAAVELAVADDVAAEPSDDVPDSDLVAALTAIASEVLGGVPVGAREDFFRLGGDSVQATQFIARVREWLDIGHAVVGDVFAARTAHALADRLADRDDPVRLAAVGRIYLEVAAMSDDEVLTGL